MPFDPIRAHDLAPNKEFDTQGLIRVTDGLRRRAMEKEGMCAMEEKSNGVV